MLSFLLKGAAVLRVPVLYGDVEKLEESAITVMFDKVQNSTDLISIDHCQQRFPTYVKDVGRVCRQIAESRLQVTPSLYLEIRLFRECGLRPAGIVSCC